MQNINIRENGLTVEFGIREDGIVELLDFTAEGVANTKMTPTDPEVIFRSLRCRCLEKRHGTCMHISTMPEVRSFDFRYDTHSLKETANGKELITSDEDWIWS